jgi:hypothetical protein
MPDPIQPNSSSSSFQDLTCSENGEPPLGPRCAPECNAKSQPISCEEEASSEHLLELMKSFPSPSAPTRAAPGVGNNNAERVSQTPLQLAYADSGRTDNGSKYAALALAYGSDASGHTYELGSISIQKGAQSEVQAAALRLTATNAGGDSLTFEALSVQNSGGTHNKDGSTGFNASAGVAGASIEATKRFGASSVTIGYSAGPAIEGSVGTRDIDGDGALEWCLRAGATVTVGACIEEPSSWRP